MRQSEILKSRRTAALNKAEGIITAAEQANRSLTATEQTDVDACMAEVNNLNPQITRLENMSSVRAQFPKHVIMEDLSTPQSDRHSFGDLRAALSQANPQQMEEIAALGAFLTGRASASADLAGAGGAVFIPQFVAATVEKNFSQFSPVVNLCRKFPTQDGAPTVFPVVSDSEEGEQIATAADTGADSEVSGNAPPTAITGPTLTSYKLSSKPILVPRELTTDAPINVVAEILGALLARVIRLENKKYTNGTGTGEAQGFLEGCSVFTSSAPSLNLDVALDLCYAVPALYRARGVFMASDTTVKFLRKLKTGIASDQRPLWTEGDVKTGTPPTLHGYPVIINNDMDSVETDGSFSGSELAFGDFQRFVVRQAENAQPFVYQYQVPQKDGVGVLVLRRSDSRILVPEAIARLVASGS
jgi:HK97 family phage major capsid protein